MLSAIDLAVDAGEIVTRLGPNGCGKSTLLRTLLGAVPSSTGAVRRRDGPAVGYVRQTPPIDATLLISVGRFLDLPVRAPRRRATRRSRGSAPTASSGGR